MRRLLRTVICSPAALNRSFFRLLVSRRGWPLALSALPLHFAYYLYSSVAFAAGAVLYFLVWRRRPVVRHSRLLERAGASTQET